MANKFMVNMCIDAITVLESETGNDTILITLHLPPSQYGESAPVAKITASHKTGVKWVRQNFPLVKVKVIYV